jgi:drug/metabolite transporter (DMT)-like permease
MTPPNWLIRLQSRPNEYGIVMMSLSMAVFIVNDTLMKWVCETLPAFQGLFLRGVASTLMILGIAWRLGTLSPLKNAWNHYRHPTVQKRALFDAMATSLYMSALFHLPIANATAINMFTPLFMVLIASSVLSEKVSGKRWFLIGLGFVGVLFIVQPDQDGFNAWAWVCVAGTVFQAIRDLTTRYIPKDTPPLIISISNAASVTVLTGLFSLFQGWQAFGFNQFLGLLGAAACLSLAHYLLILATRSGDISLIAPFRYSGLLFALISGFVIWGDWPNLLAWLGIVLLVFAGLAMLRSRH